MDKSLDECDLVMKGGITSGIVYPPAILGLKERYRFRNIGGASVGAIAAAVTAAAEYGRQMGTGGFGPLAEISAELPGEGFLQSLFQPRRELRGVYRVVVEASKRSRTRIPRAAWAIVRSQWIAALAFGGAWAALAAWAIVTSTWRPVLVAGLLWCLAITPVLLTFRRDLRWRLLSAFVYGPVSYALWPFIVLVLWMAARSYKEIDKPGFGVCTGMPVGAGAPPSLTTWLHSKIQNSSGAKGPLTFRDLEKAGVSLKVMSTDLSLARPVTLPSAITGYMFECEDMKTLFPPDVVRHLTDDSISSEVPGTKLRKLKDARDLPVLVAFRLSMSFPILFTAVPLYAWGPRVRKGGDAVLVLHWLSDGGIGSNFPIHFFDSWFPRRPTFGLNLGPFPQTPNGIPVPDTENVELPESPVTEPELQWIKIGSSFAFAHQILDTMENWRDTLQSELPGFRERVARIHLAEGEGGMNIGMQRSAIESLISKGEEAGVRLLNDFDWQQHRFTRFVLMMQMLQRRLLGETDRATDSWITGVRENFDPYHSQLASGQVPAGYLWGRNVAWCAKAAKQTAEFLDLAATWLGPPHGGGPDDTNVFDGGDPPIPQSVLRIVPPV